MEINQLLRVLKHGEAYNVEAVEQGEPHQVLRPPTKHTLRAARVIEGLVKVLGERDAQIQQLQALLAKYPELSKELQ